MYTPNAMFEDVPAVKFFFSNFLLIQAEFIIAHNAGGAWNIIMEVSVA